MLVEDEASMADLWNTQQIDSKTLKSFMTHLKNVMVKISNVGNDSTLTALKNRLCYNSRFREEMTVNRPLSKTQFIARPTSLWPKIKMSILADMNNAKKAPQGNSNSGGSQNQGEK